MKRTSLVSLALAIAGTAALAIGAGAPATAATAPDTSGIYTVHPIVEKAALATSALTPSFTPADCLAQTGGRVACQTPETIRAAYDIPATIGGVPAGTGQTVVIVDAFGSPTVASDLATFSQTFGLPAPHLTVYYPGGKPTWNGRGTQTGWAEETSLDVQWAHAVAPGANIALVIAANDHGASIDNAVRYAVDNRLGNVLSMSYGEADYLIASPHANNGQTTQAQKSFAKAAAAGMSLFASSGDDGSDNGAGYPNFGFPASDPNVTAVGGTNVWAGSGLNAPHDTVWGDYADCPLTCAFGIVGETGGAPSLFLPKGGSDVAYNASVYTGVLTYLGFLGGDANGFYYFGGTSAGSPQWAALTADAIQAVGHTVGNVSHYAQGWAASGILFDVTQGSNATPTYTGGYSATSGWDRPTGWGTPDVGRIIAALK
ncbi:S53 family peptidase [uncultured Leifsonia sp.]|uniref:S53 family peptidase n=1 Tax=uncultured Leifsonia sp. TaxID=340359 RepID=UPI0028D228F4|nr:S53 family peptidase [uncultured Leifsonia sp.]